MNRAHRPVASRDHIEQGNGTARLVLQPGAGVVNVGS